MTQALTCLTQLLQGRKRLQDLQIVRETCLQNCPWAGFAWPSSGRVGRPYATT